MDTVVTFKRPAKVTSTTPRAEMPAAFHTAY